jgi:hypothetical protein
LRASTWLLPEIFGHCFIKGSEIMEAILIYATNAHAIQSHRTLQTKGSHCENKKRKEKKRKKKQVVIGRH